MELPCGAMIRVDGGRFVDEQGRELLLRGVNLGGSTKVPRVPDGATWRREHFFEHRDVSFVGRPFPLDEADEHFRRLARWGLKTLRFLTTWEAIEHAGPRRYDLAYLEYLEAIVRRAGEHGLDVFIDFHQDVWSRFTGGDGAPGWTLEAAGFALENLHETGAAFVHCMNEGPLPRMIWPSNAGKLAAATMFTLFFAGDAFAPRRTIDGVGAQRFLQEHFFGAMEQVVTRLKNVPCVFGYDVLNEPAVGYIGWDDLTKPHGPVWVGALPSPLESMALGVGQAREIDVWKRDIFGARITGKTTVNPRQLRAWRDGFDCPWREHGVWDVGSRGEPVVKRPDAFLRAGGRDVTFQRDFYKPFLRAGLERARAIDPRAVVFIEAEPFQPAPAWSRADGENVAYAPHWYDGVVLFLKSFHSFLGVDAFTEQPVFLPPFIRRSYRDQLLRYVEESRARLGGMPVLLGELGIAFDLNGGEAFRTGDFSAQAAAMDRSMVAVEDSRLHATLWNYTSDNDHAHGDQWNDEDLSIWSSEDGARAADAVIRPYPMAIAGELLRYSFERSSRTFEMVFRHSGTTAPTQIFVPELHYPHGPHVSVSDGRYELDAAAQRLDWFHDASRAEHTLRLTAK